MDSKILLGPDSLKDMKDEMKGELAKVSGAYPSQTFRGLYVANAVIRIPDGAFADIAKRRETKTNVMYSRFKKISYSTTVL